MRAARCSFAHGALFKPAHDFDQGSTPANQRAARGLESAGHGEDFRKSDDGDRSFLGIDPRNTSPAIRWPAPWRRALHIAGQSRSDPCIVASRPLSAETARLASSLSTRMSHRLVRALLSLSG